MSDNNNSEQGITVNGSTVTFGGSVVYGDQVGHTGGTIEGDVIVGRQDDDE